MNNLTLLITIEVGAVMLKTLINGAPEAFVCLPIHHIFHSEAYGGLEDRKRVNLTTRFERIDGAKPKNRIQKARSGTPKDVPKMNS